MVNSVSYPDEKFTSRFYPPVTIINPKNGSSITIPCFIDTGSWSVMLEKHAKQIGIDTVTDGYKSFTHNAGGGRTTRYNLHTLLVQIGNFKPVKTEVYIGANLDSHSWINLREKADKVGILGWANNGLINWIIDMVFNKITFTEYPSPKQRIFNNLTKLNTYKSLEYIDTRYKDKIVKNFFPIHNVTFYNVKTGLPSLTTEMVPDTGATFSVLHTRYAKMLGIDDITTGTENKVTDDLILYRHDVKIKIGKLPPVNTRIDFGDFPLNILGTITLNLFRVIFRNNRIYYSINKSSPLFNG